MRPTHNQTKVAGFFDVARLKLSKLQLSPSPDPEGGSGAMVEHAPGMADGSSGPESLTPGERFLLLALARSSLVNAAMRCDLPSISPEEITPHLAEKRACFVTLTTQGVLRGCVGNMLPEAALHKTVAKNARNAATRDPRFSPVTSGELEQVRIEISVLTEPKPLSAASTNELLEKLRPCVDGVLLRIGRRLATFLPKVWEQVPDKADFLNRLAEKAGCEPWAWQLPESSVLTYQAECFREEQPAPVGN